ncbi:MAG: hypothetical protein HY308_01160 [Gammaproteobacteria bacterium]|nr:hypothetical protein [Gammaproteobacteria bacterium]
MQTTYIKIFSSISAMLMLLSCGGGSGDGATSSQATQCRAGVVSGFVRDVEAPPVYHDGGGHDPDGGDGGSSSGVGGGLGKVLRGLVRVSRITDGASIGEAYTDSVNGLVTVTTCDKAPLLITLKGAAGAKYFDEGKNALVDFGPDQEIHALVDVVDENIGVSSFTEAAYRYAINNYLVESAKIADGTVPLRKTADVTGLSVARIAAANQLVLAELNRALPSAYQLSSLKALPTPITADSASDSLASTRHGLAAVVTGGFVRMASQFLLTEDLPALQATEELARDLTDGTINGAALDGTASAPGRLPMYDAVHLPIAFSVGANSVAQQFSLMQNFSAAPFVAEVIYVRGHTSDIDGICGWQDGAELLKDGSVLVRRRFMRLAASVCQLQSDETRIANFAVDVKQLIPNQFRAQGFLIKTNGDVLTWGPNKCGLLGIGTLSGPTLTPVQITGLTNVTSLATGDYYAIARDGAGNVYSWGADIYGALGLGNTPKEGTCDVTDTWAVPTNAHPLRIPGLSHIVNVFSKLYSVFAVDQNGVLYGWGKGGNSFANGPDAPDRSTPELVAGVTAVKAVAFTSNVVFALKRDGTLVGWGSNENGSFGDGTTDPKYRPTVLTAIRDVKELAGTPAYTDVFYALKFDGSVWRWGGTNSSYPRTPTLVTDLPPIRHINSVGDDIYLYTQDGQILRHHDGENPT